MILPGLLMAVAGTGLLLCLLLALQLRGIGMRLKSHRSKQPGFADLLNYAAVVDDGVIVCKDGALMAAWSYQGADNASSTDDEREIVSFRINQLVGQLGNGWMWHVDALRSPAPAYSAASASRFPDPVTRVIDDERREPLLEQVRILPPGQVQLRIQGGDLDSALTVADPSDGDLTEDRQVRTWPDWVEARHDTGWVGGDGACRPSGPSQ